MDPDVAETGQPYAFTGDDPLNESDPSGLDYHLNDQNPILVEALGEAINGSGDALSVLKEFPISKYILFALNVLDGAGKLTGQGTALIDAARKAEKRASKAGLNRIGESRKIGYVDLDIVTWHLGGIDTHIPTGTIVPTVHIKNS